MELYEYFLILRKKQRVLWATLAVFLVSAVSWQVTQGERYGSTLLLNISRSGSQQTSEYTYDGFYRLQADERFADTVVRWLGAPRISEDILRDADIDTGSLSTNDLTRFFTSGRLSSQVIRVEYVAGSEAVAGKISESVTRILNTSATALNRDAKDPSWFVIDGDAPVIRDARVPFWKAFVVAFVAGIFFGFWAVMFLEYWEKQRGRKEILDRGYEMPDSR